MVVRALSFTRIAHTDPSSKNKPTEPISRPTEKAALSSPNPWSAFLGPTVSALLSSKETPPETDSIVLEQGLGRLLSPKQAEVAKKQVEDWLRSAQRSGLAADDPRVLIRSVSWNFHITPDQSRSLSIFLKPEAKDLQEAAQKINQALDALGLIGVHREFISDKRSVSVRQEDRLQFPQRPKIAPRVSQALSACAASYGTEGVNNRLSSMLKTRWFRRLRKDDQIRATKAIAHFASMERDATDPFHRTLMTNTMDHVLNPSGRIRLRFGLEFSSASGTAGLRTITLKRSSISADPIPLKNEPDLSAMLSAFRVAIDTLTHEVNHLRNPALVAPTFKYFMDEYRAFYSGHLASQGYRPTAREAYQWILTLVGPNSAYPVLKRALRKNTSSWPQQPSQDAARIIGFINRFAAKSMSSQDPNSANAAVKLLPSGLSDPGAPAPLPEPLGSLLNE